MSKNDPTNGEESHTVQAFHHFSSFANRDEPFTICVKGKGTKQRIWNGEKF